jgi:hypothetical protein
VYQHWRFTLPDNSLWVWLGALLAYDFCYYWAHRMGHEVSVLWAAHEVHHSSEYYNRPPRCVRRPAAGSGLAVLSAAGAGRRIATGHDRGRR